MTRRILAVVGMLAIVGALFALPKQETEASWAPTTTYAQGAFTADLPAPIVTQCTTSNILILGAQTVIKWKYAPSLAATPAPTAQFASTSGALSSLSIVGPNTTGPVSGVYTTTFSSGLLSGLLGGDGYVAVRTNQNGWQSDWSAVYGTIPFLIGSGSCTIL